MNNNPRIQMAFITLFASAICFLSFTAGAFPNAECDQFRASLPSDFIQGTVEVPEDWNRPKENLIEVFYYGKLSAQRSPIAFLNGGPASSSHSYFKTMQKISEAQKLPIIYVDQRGTGCSTSYPSQKVSSENLERLTLYGSDSIVQDLEAIRTKLIGSKSWQILGHSYGALLAHRYVEIAPNSLISAHAYGYAFMDDMIRWRMERNLAQDRVFREYLKDFPTDEQLVTRIRNQIDALPNSQKCFSQSTTSICGSAVLDVLAMSIGYHARWPTVHQILVSLLDDEGKLLSGNLTQFVQQQIFGSLWGDYFAFFTMTKLEISSPVGSRNSCEMANAQLVKEGSQPDQWTLQDCRLTTAFSDPVVIPLVESASFGEWPSLTEFAAALNAHPSLPFFLYSGELDSTVPMATFTQESRVLTGRINFTMFPQAGHDGIFTENQIWKDLDAAFTSKSFER